jgi:hypothetical protein
VIVSRKNLNVKKIRLNEPAHVNAAESASYGRVSEKMSFAARIPASPGPLDSFNRLPGGCRENL